jgi:pyruvate dehydrogenase E1 component alpha subunit
VTATPEIRLDPLQILDPTGTLVGPAPDLDEQRLVELHRWMALSRIIDRRAMGAQRQGRLGTYAMLEGHEAVHIGSALAFAGTDFIYPAYRQLSVQMARGMPLDVILSYWRGLPTEDWDVQRYRMMTIAVPIASQIAHAVGHAYATRQRGEDTVVGTYFGDGATSENDFHSGLNFAGVWNTPNVFICENNLYAISVPYRKQTASETIAQKATAYGIRGIRVDGMDPLAMYQATREAVDRARAGDGPTLIEALTFRYGPHATADDPSLYRHESEVAEWREKDPISRMRAFLTAGGLWDDDREAALLEEGGTMFEKAMQQIEDAALPGRDSIVRNAYSRIPESLIDQLHDLQRGAGEPLTEFSADERWPEPGEEPVPGPEAPGLTMADAINQALHQAMEADDTMLVLGEDVGLAGGVFRITAGLQKRFGEDRVIDTPINESGIVGAAIGMGISGSRAVAEIQFDGFLYPAFDQVASHLGRLRFRSRGNASLPVVVRFPNGAGIGAHEHHCDSPEAFLMHAPGLIVVVPSTPYDAKGLLTTALRMNDPVVFLEPKVLYRSIKEPVPEEPYEVPIGVAKVRREGSDLTLVTYGGMVPVAERAARAVAADGIDVEVIDLRTIYPWDTQTVVASAEKTGRLLLVQEPQRSAGVAAEVAAHVAEVAGYSLEAPIRRLTGTDAPWPQFAIEDHALIREHHVVHAIRDVVAS